MPSITEYTCEKNKNPFLIIGSSSIWEGKHLQLDPDVINKNFEIVSKGLEAETDLEVIC